MGSTGSARFRTLPYAVGAARTPEARRAVVFEVNSRLREGQLEIAWVYSTSLHRHETVEQLADAVIAELAAVANGDGLPAAAALTPSDFPAADLDQADLTTLLERMQ